MTDQHNTQAALHAAEIGLANLVSYQSSGNTPSIHEFGQARRALDSVRVALAAQPTPEPTFAGIAGRKLDDLKAQGYAVDGYSIQHTETKQRGFITTGGFVGWWINMDHVQPGTEPVAQAGCGYCQHPLFAGTKCKSCGRVPVALQGRDDFERLIDEGVIYLPTIMRRDHTPGSIEHMMRDAAESAWQAARASLPAGGVVEPVAWRGRNSLGEVVTDWLEYQHQTAEGVKKLFADEGGTVEYAYAATRPSETQGRRQMTDEQREAFAAGYEAAQQDAQACQLPPMGWRCTRKAGHEGPCAALETDDSELVQRGMDRLREGSYGIPASPQDGGGQA